MSKSTINKHFPRVHDYRKQMWYVLEAFMHFLISVGKVPQDTIDKYPLRTFRLYRFLNDVPIFSKDKRGINISILIIQVLFFLTKRRHDMIRDRVDALNQYCRRYLYRDDTFRSSCFIKMLTELPKANFNRMRAERYAQKHVKKLATMPISETRQGIETEPVPYEHLWEMILQQLD